MDRACKYASYRLVLTLTFVGGVVGCQAVPQEVSAPAMPVVSQDALTASQNSQANATPVHSTLADARDNVVCIGAIGDQPETRPSWTTDKAFHMSVAEAQKRGLTPEDCVVILSTVSSTNIAKALASREKNRSDSGKDGSPSVSDLIARADPNNSIWRGQPWGNSRSQIPSMTSRVPNGSRDARSEALQFVQSRGAANQLEKVFTDLTTGLSSYKNLEKSNPGPLLKRLLSERVKAAVKRYGHEWEQILADILAEHFSLGELRSLNASGHKSAYYRKFLAKKYIVNQQIRERAEKILVKGAVTILLQVHREIKRYQNAGLDDLGKPNALFSRPLALVARKEDQSTSAGSRINPPPYPFTGPSRYSPVQIFKTFLFDLT